VTSSEPVRQIRYQRPPGATELLLVRHGESAPAIEGESFQLVDGHGDPPLSPEGMEQAERVGERLAREGGIDAVYVTTLRRTVETAAPFLRLVGDDAPPVAVEPDLREVHLGEWEGGLFRTKVLSRDPVAVRMLTEERWDVIPGAEPADVFGARIRAAVERIHADHPDQRVAVFTHGGVIGRILSEASGARAFAFNNADNASISHVVVAGGWWAVRRFNDTTHLEVGFTTRSAPLT
jgi:2,3-bisphosphoglycerate-dependent phosphoglycerate mutase